MKENSEAGAEYRTQVLMWLGMTVSAAMYYVLVRMVRPAAPQDNPALVNILLVMGAVLVIASFIVKSARVPRRLALLIGLAVCEAGALCGVVVWFLTASTRCYLLLGLGFAGMLLHFPRRSE